MLAKLATHQVVPLLDHAIAAMVAWIYRNPECVIRCRRLVLLGLLAITSVAAWAQFDFANGRFRIDLDASEDD